MRKSPPDQGPTRMFGFGFAEYGSHIPLRCPEVFIPIFMVHWFPARAGVKPYWEQAHRILQQRRAHQSPRNLSEGRSRCARCVFLPRARWHGGVTHQQSGKKFPRADYWATAGKVVKELLFCGFGHALVVDNLVQQALEDVRQVSPPRVCIFGDWHGQQAPCLLKTIALVHSCRFRNSIVM